MFGRVNKYIAAKHLTHDGPVIAVGFICPTDKKNRNLQIIKGLWSVHMCSKCGEYYAKPSDLLEPEASPDADTLHSFAQEEDEHVEVEGSHHIKARLKAAA